MLKNERRKMFRGDAVDFITGTCELAGVEELDINSLSPFKGHPFRLYEGERLDDMVESIKENGILVPVIVRKLEEGYEILAGHNRVNAGKIAGLEKIPCIVKDNLSDDDAYVYVIETNLMQRSFNDLLPSEKALVLVERYENIKNQGKRNDIIKELKILNGEEFDDTASSRESIGKQYGLSSSSVARLIRINSLIPEFKVMLDNDNLALLTGVDLSYLSNEQQKMVYDFVSENNCQIAPGKARIIRSMASDNVLTIDNLLKLYSKTEGKEDYKKVRVAGNTYKRYFADMTPKQAEEVIEKALEEYFATR